MSNYKSNKAHINVTEASAWEVELDRIIGDNNSLNLGGRPARPATMKDRSSFLRGTFAYLRAFGYMEEVDNLKPKHIKVLCEHYQTKRLAPSTIRKYLSYLEAFCFWIGKGGMLHGHEAYFDEGYLNQSIATFERKQPESFDLLRMLSELRSSDGYVWHQLIVQVTFDLGRKHTMLLAPGVDVQDDKLHVISRTKGKGIHIIPIQNEFQKKVIERARNFVGGATNNLCLPGRNAQKSMKHFSNTLHRAGIGKVKSSAMLIAIETLIMKD